MFCRHLCIDYESVVLTIVLPLNTILLVLGLLTMQAAVGMDVPQNMQEALQASCLHEQGQSVCIQQQGDTAIIQILHKKEDLRRHQ